MIQPEGSIANSASEEYLLNALEFCSIVGLMIVCHGDGCASSAQYAARIASVRHIQLASAHHRAHRRAASRGALVIIHLVRKQGKGPQGASSTQACGNRHHAAEQCFARMPTESNTALVATVQKAAAQLGSAMMRTFSGVISF